jgi:hypothetical protein
MFGTSRTEDTVSETYKGFFDASLLSPSCSHYALLLYQNPLFPLPCLGQIERAIRCLKYKDFSNASLSSSFLSLHTAAAVSKYNPSGGDG